MFDPFSKFMAMQDEAAKLHCIAEIVKDYKRGVDVNDNFYLKSIGFFDFSPTEQEEIIREATMKIRYPI